MQALAASGLRSLRYAREVDGLEKVVALDNDKGNTQVSLLLYANVTNSAELKFGFLSSASVEACKRNIKFNGAAAVNKVEAHLADARVYMLTHPKEFDVVRLLNISKLNLLWEHRAVSYSMLYPLVCGNSGRFSGNINCGFFPSLPLFLCSVRQTIEYEQLQGSNVVTFEVSRLLMAFG
jgi:hypothetical protein